MKNFWMVNFIFMILERMNFFLSCLKKMSARERMSVAYVVNCNNYFAV